MPLPFIDLPLIQRRARLQPWNVDRIQLELILDRQSKELESLEPTKELRLAQIHACREVWQLSLEFREAFGEGVGKHMERIQVHAIMDGDHVYDHVVAVGDRHVERLLASNPLGDSFLKAKMRVVFTQARDRVALQPDLKRMKRLTRGSKPPDTSSEKEGRQRLREARLWARAWHNKYVLRDDGRELRQDEIEHDCMFVVWECKDSRRWLVLAVQTFRPDFTVTEGLAIEVAMRYATEKNLIGAANLAYVLTTKKLVRIHTPSP